MRENIKLEQRIQQWITAYEEATKKHTQEVSLLKMQLQKLKVVCARHLRPQPLAILFIRLMQVDILLP